MKSSVFSCQFSAKLLALLVGAVIGISIVNYSHLPQVQAQASPLFQTSFSAVTGTTVIPPCTTQPSTPTTPCIANQSQTAGSVSFNWTFGNTSGVSGYIFIEGSNDNVNWLILAQDVQFNCTSSCTGGGQIFYNGAYTFIKIYISIPANGKLAAVYTAFPQTIPINVTTDQVTNILPGIPRNATPVGFGIANPLVVSGFQCYNDSASTIYLQLFKSTSGGSPALGSLFFYEIGIPTKTTFVYPGPPIALANMFPLAGTTGTFWAGAATAHGGGTFTPDLVECTFEISTPGPFYPLTPVGP